MTVTQSISCGIVATSGKCVELAHGEGGLAMRRLLKKKLLPRLGNRQLDKLEDGAVLDVRNGQQVISTDSFVVSPLFFPGGDIGRLSVIGTSNDVAVMGARPRWMSLAMILEEGLPFDILERVIESISVTARELDIEIVTGDTKVVPRGAADGMFLNTTGLGVVGDHPPQGAHTIRPGDCLLVTGPIGRHGMAVLAARQELACEPLPTSDCDFLYPAVKALEDSGIKVRAMRDATRGGVAAVLHEWAEASRCSIVIDESHIPVTSEVRGLSELLGLDPLFIANEGTMCVAVDEQQVDHALKALRCTNVAKSSAYVGRFRESSIVPVAVRRTLNREIPLDEPLGAPFPRIC